MLRTRILTAVIALPALLLAILFTPQSLFRGLVLIATLLALREAIALGKFRTVISLPLVGIGLGVCVYVMDRNGIEELAWSVVAGLTLLIVFLEVIPISERVNTGITEKVAGVLATIYVATLFPYFALLRQRNHGIRALLLTVMLVTTGDSAAYFVGRKFGATKLAPHVSPNKTVEGALASLGSNLVIGPLLEHWLSVSREDFWIFVLKITALNLIGQLGDLAESALKRLGHIKDSGQLFPGHGGLLDRADSLVFAVVFAYYYLS